MPQFIVKSFVILSFTFSFWKDVQAQRDTAAYSTYSPATGWSRPFSLTKPGWEQPPKFKSQDLTAESRSTFVPAKSKAENGPTSQRKETASKSLAQDPSEEIFKYTPSEIASMSTDKKIRLYTRQIIELEKKLAAINEKNARAIKDAASHYFSFRGLDGKYYSKSEFKSNDVAISQVQTYFKTIDALETEFYQTKIERLEKKIQDLRSFRDVPSGRQSALDYQFNIASEMRIDEIDDQILQLRKDFERFSVLRNGLSSSVACADLEGQPSGGYGHMSKEKETELTQIEIEMNLRIRNDRISKLKAKADELRTGMEEMRGDKNLHAIEAFGKTSLNPCEPGK